MNIETYLKAAVLASREKTLSESDQLSIGEMILKLEPIVSKQKERIENNLEEATVKYDFEYLFPTSIDSWRGSYNELALNFTSVGNEMKVSEFTVMLKDTIGKEFTGYKGGEFIMSKRTPVWVANYGNAGNTAVIDIIDNGYNVIIITGYREF